MYPLRSPLTCFSTHSVPFPAILVDTAKPRQVELGAVTSAPGLLYKRLARTWSPLCLLLIPAHQVTISRIFNRSPGGHQTGCIFEQHEDSPIYSRSSCVFVFHIVRSGTTAFYALFAILSDGKALRCPRPMPGCLRRWKTMSFNPNISR